MKQLSAHYVEDAAAAKAEEDESNWADPNKGDKENNEEGENEEDAVTDADQEHIKEVLEAR